MKLCLMRHCHAEEGEREDRQRGLTDLGEAQAKIMHDFLKLAEIEPDIIITSQFARAIETAEAVQRKDTPIKKTAALDPPAFTCDVDTDKAWRGILKLAGDAKKVLVVTHGPLIEPLLASVAFAFNHIEWEHGSIAYVNTSESKFRWFVTPKLAAHILGEDPDDVENPPDLVEAAAAVAVELATEIAFRESLNRAEKASVVDPLIGQVKKALRIRWNAQLKAFENHGLPLLKDALDARQTLPSNAGPPDDEKRKALAVLGIRHQQFAVKFRNATRAAYDAGADLVAGKLVKPKEATKKHPQFPGPTREPEEVEDDLDETTEDRASTLVDHAFRDSLGYAALVIGARQMFKGWSEGENSRADTVALQEVSSAYHDGGRDYVNDWRGGNGPVEKLWETEDDPCEVCEANADMGSIDSEAPFDSGDFEPPAHPNCRCSLSYQAVSE